MSNTNIVLIGFSGTGKSHWSKRLADCFGYSVLCCDDLIEQKLANVLPEDCQGIDGVARWMGHPDSPQYPENAAQYLALEEQVLQEILSQPTYPANTILDTTGSVIYCQERLQQQLSAFGQVVYLEVTPEVLTEMFQVYLSDPKPLIWGNSFSMLEAETVEFARQRSYSELLTYRQSAYEGLAQVSLNYQALRQPGIEAADFIRMCEG